MDIFSCVIRYLSEEFYKELEKGTAGFDEDDVLWVITVPAIWSDSAKQFMRESANKAGISDKNLKFILEPEAASLYCNSKKMCKVRKIDDSMVAEELPIGHKYIVADLGGGTADLSVHEILEDRNLREIRRADGGAYGGIMVDKAFAEFIDDIFGTEMMEQMKTQAMHQMIDLRREFEVKKRNFVTEKEIRIKIPVLDLQKALNANSKQMTEIEQALKEKYDDKVRIKSDKLIFHKDVMEKFFKEPVDAILKFIKEMREDEELGELGEIDTILMVGGFSGSDYIQQRVKKEMPDVRIIVPTEPVLSVLKGAVLFGNNPKIIKERRAQYSYGLSCARIFKEGDPEELKVTQNGKTFCNNVFDKLITKNKNVKIDETFASLIAHEANMDNIMTFVLSKIMPLEFEVFRSTKEDPKYTTEADGSELIGTVVIAPPTEGWPIMSFFAHGIYLCETEFHPFAKNLETGEIFSGKIDFL